MEITAKRILAIAIILGIALRMSTFGYAGFLEPDNYVYYTTIQQTIANHMHITSLLSGFPVAQPFTERPLLILLPAYLSLVFGNLYLIMKLLPVVFGALEIFMAYKIGRKLGMATGIISAFAVAILVASITMNLSGEWRGDSFVPLFIECIIYLMVSERRGELQRLPAYSGMAVFLALSISMWRGGIYAFAVVGFALFADLMRKWLGKSRLYPIFLLGALGALAIAYGAASTFYPAVFPQIFVSTNIERAIAEQGAASLGFLSWAYGAWLPLAMIGLAIFSYKRMDSPEFSPMFSFIALGLFMQAMETRWMSLLAIPCAIFGAYGIAESLRFAGSYLRLPISPDVAVAMLLLGTLFFTMLALQSYPYADGINPQFMSALSWIRNNTPSNSTFVTLWPDGSLVEGWSNRITHSDSMQAGIDLGFMRWLWEPAGNLTWLYNVSPDYLLVRKYWVYGFGNESHPDMYNELLGIRIQANITQSPPYPNTNFYALENGDVPFPMVFENNNTIIYRLGHGK